VLEDIHWADKSTLLALRSLASARPDVAVLWVLTVRTGAGGPAVQETLSVLQRTNAGISAGARDDGGRGRRDGQDVVRASADESLLTLAARRMGIRSWSASSWAVWARRAA